MKIESSTVFGPRSKLIQLASSYEINERLYSQPGIMMNFVRADGKEQRNREVKVVRTTNFEIELTPLLVQSAQSLSQ